jgi:hypothetical protein
MKRAAVALAAAFAGGIVLGQSYFLSVRTALYPFAVFAATPVLLLFLFGTLPANSSRSAPSHGPFASTQRFLRAQPPDQNQAEQQ